MVFFNPVFYALKHELAHHGLVGGGFVAATRTVAICAICCLAVEIVGIGKLEVGVIDVVGMVIHHVENHTDTRIVERLYHLFKLTDTHLWIVRIGGIASLGHVVVHGIVTPVILRREVLTGRGDALGQRFVCMLVIEVGVDARLVD